MSRKNQPANYCFHRQRFGGRSQNIFMFVATAGFFLCSVQLLSADSSFQIDPSSNALPQFNPVYVKCPRKNITKLTDGPHYPNQTWYNSIIEGDPERWIVKAPLISSNTEIIIVVSSKNTHDRERVEARRSWANKYHDHILSGKVQVVFLLADNPYDQECLQFENEKFGDLLIVKASDSYRNIVYKTIMAYRYLISKHPNVHIVKVFRVVLDINELVSYFSTLGSTSLVQGYISWGSDPIRNETSQWFVPTSAFNESTFPPYAQDRFYLITRTAFNEVMKKENLDKVQVVELEDVFVTGILRKQANINISWLNEFSLSQLNTDKCPTEQDKKLIAMGSDKNIENTYNQFMSYKERGCSRTVSH